MKRFSSLMLILMLLFSCGEDRQMSVLLHDAEQLMDSIPDSAYHMLDDAHGQAMQCPRRQRMHYELLRAKAQNKAYVDFTTDSIVLAVADYYSSHGSANQQMLAYYMVGCAYRDLEDAPSALKYLNMAADIADKNGKDSDQRILLSIHSQMGGLYQNVAAFENEQKEDFYAEQVAWQIGDTASAIHLMWTQACSLYESGKHSEAILILDSIDRIIKENDMQKEPILLYPMKIEDRLEHEDLNGARSLIYKYECETGITPDSPDEEIIDIAYFNRKGKYYVMAHQPDSAILMFHRLQNILKLVSAYASERHGLTQEANRGLMDAYSLKHQSDSAIKYANQYCLMNDSTTLDNSSEQLLRMQSLYNYSRIQEQAFQSKSAASRLRFTMLLLILAGISLSMAAWFMYRKRLRVERQKQIEANREYRILIQQFDKAEDELRLFKTDSARFLEEKETEILQLRATLARYQANNIDPEQWSSEHEIIGCKVAKCLHAQSTKAQKATYSEFRSLQTVAESAFPEFYATVTNSAHKLTELEVIVCVLIRFQFIPSEITALTGNSSQRITNLKSNINKKLFGTPGAKTLDSHLMALK